MSAQDILIAHGEKALVLLVTAACGYALYGTFTNPEIRPTDISMEKINEMVGKVEKERGNQAPPVMKAPSNYLDDMIARWAVQLPSAKYYAILSAVTDVGPIDIRSSQYYIYEIHPPKVSVTDAIGNLDLTIDLPAPQRTNDVRISDASTKTWSLEGRADNKAQWLGLQVEFRVGTAEWQPLNGKDVKNGLLTLKDGTNSYTVSMPTVEPWQRHHFRARLIAKATGLPLDTMKSNDQQQTILVSQGTYADPAIDWAKLQADLADVVTGNKAVIDKFLKGSGQGAFSEQLRSGELLYRSGDSDEATVLATDSIRFVFDKVNQNFQNPMQTGATLLLTKYLRDPRATDKKTGKWMDKPFTYKLLPGEALGNAMESIPDPFSGNVKQSIPVDLSTAYVLTAVKEKVKRVVYYEIFAKSRPMGGKSKDLEVNVKEIETEIATLSNTKTGTELSLPRCERVTKPNKPLSIFYPDFAGLSYDEAGEFKKNPAGFKQNQLVPKPPVKHDPGTGPLEDLRKRRNDPLLRTDTPYYELPDGRIVYWEDVNHKMVVFIKPGSEAAADAEVAAKEAAEKEAAEKAKAAADAAAAAATDAKDKASKDPKEAKDAKPAPK
jgi:hypothetical protein